MHHTLIASLIVFCALHFGCATADRVDSTPAVEVAEPQLRAELIDLFNRDQRARKDMLRAMRAAPPPSRGDPYHESVLPLVRIVQDIDAESAAFLEDTISRHGWPTFDMVGRDGAESAWLLAQHADARPDLQQRVLALMEPLVARGQAHPGNFAYLTDRVRVAQRLPQVYGTQFAADAQGVQRPYPIDDAAAVDRRRAAVGIPPIANAVRQTQRAMGGRATAQPLEEFPPD